jgi:hypothetical protein
MLDGAQVIEKNHFPMGQNRATPLPMSHAPDIEQTRRKGRMVLLLLAAAIAAATVAPMVVLAG